MRYLVLFIVCLSLIITLACDRIGNPCCIRVGDACVTRHEFKSRVERFAEESMITSNGMIEKMKPVIVDNIIEEYLILEYARKHYISVSQEEVEIAMKGLLGGISEDAFEDVLTEDCRHTSDMEEFIRHRAIMRKAIDKAVRTKINVGPLDIEGYYNKHKYEFMTGSSVELYHVFSRDNYKARKALVMLRSGTSLYEVVDKFSESEDARDHGFMGVFVRGELPKEVEDVVFTIPELRYSKIIKTSRGHHIFYVAKRCKPRILTIEEAKDGIKDLLSEKQFEQKYKDWIISLKKEYEPKVNWDEIKAISID